ncbi:cupin domain-containing protein [Streptacidiphilus sp. P02-A3a]|uniref:cupin domain-containing protein n=1 Tax=Streptacidiphilus sp. P02-A3a TaxID=2704468 RepID=UPI0015FC3538|nr:cupin domain-containing protein [Streptacidiphilus sp. P02-A3a]QMU68091.1 cupin domain-containing protein [Streptacidiphilus sp. P02-A3a]
MPFIRSADAVTHEIHGVRFVSYAAPATGSSELCAWRGEVPAGTAGVPHTVSREEVLYLLSGALRFTVDGEAADLAAGDAVVVPSGAELRLDNVSGEPAAIWTATAVGLTATMADGSVIAPPWAN